MITNTCIYTYFEEVDININNMLSQHCLHIIIINLIIVLMTEPIFLSGLDFKRKYGFGPFACFINYGRKSFLPSHGVNSIQKMVPFYIEKDVTLDMEFCDIAKIDIPDNAEVEVINGTFKTNKFITIMFVTRNRFSYARFSKTIPYK